jgi:hypothetical protein
VSASVRRTAWATEPKPPTGRDDLEAVVTLVAEAPEHLEDRELVADDHDAVEVLALRPAAVQPATQRVALPDGHDGDHGEADQDVVAGDLDLGRVRREGHDGDQRDARAGDPTELL